MAMQVPVDLADDEAAVFELVESLSRIEGQDLIDATWEELEVRGVRMMNHWVMVRIDPPELRDGRIWLPPTRTGSYSGMAHQALVKATVLAVGSKVRVLQPGSRVVFQRLYFARWRFTEDGTPVGWINCNQIAGLTD